MKTLVAVSLVAAQLFVAQPAAAADFDSALITESGTFGGVRLRLPLGGGKLKSEPQLGLTFAPMLRMQAPDGRSRVLIGDGMAFGFNGGGPARLSLAGRPLASFTPQQTGIDKTKAAGVSTLGWVAIGAAAALVVGGLLFVDALNDASD